MSLREPFRIEPPVGEPIALVLDSPHSGRWLPDDLPLAVPQHALREAEDHFVDQLWADARDCGATLLAANFARIWVDPNRHEDDVDTDLLDARWPGPLRPSGKARIGKAVVWRTLEDGRPIYARPLTPAEVQARLDAALRPYQRALGALIERTHARHGACVHLNCHSMRAVAGAMGEGGAGSERADVVLGDRDGSTCAPGLTATVRTAFESLGYRVAVNDPYKGVELVRAFSDPERGRHSLQVELNKRLYLDDAALAPAAGFEPLRADLRHVTAAVADYARTLTR